MNRIKRLSSEEEYRFELGAKSPTASGGKESARESPSTFITINPIKKGTVMKLKLRTWQSVAILALLLATPAVVSADAVSDWNAIAVQATVTAGPLRPGATGVLDIAMVQAAVYDAVQAIVKQYEPYYVEIPGATGSPVAAHSSGRQRARIANCVTLSIRPGTRVALCCWPARALATMVRDVEQIGPQQAG